MFASLKRLYVHVYTKIQKTDAIWSEETLSDNAVQHRDFCSLTPGHSSSFCFLYFFIHVRTCTTLWQKHNVLPHLCSVIYPVICVIISLKENTSYSKIQWGHETAVCDLIGNYFLWTCDWTLRYWQSDEAKLRNKYF